MFATYTGGGKEHADFVLVFTRADFNYMALVHSSFKFIMLCASTCIMLQLADTDCFRADLKTEYDTCSLHYGMDSS